MRIIQAQEISQEVSKLCISSCRELLQDVKDAFSKAYHTEGSLLGKSILSSLILNAQIAQEKQIPIQGDY